MNLNSQFAFYPAQPDNPAGDWQGLPQHMNYGNWALILLFWKRCRTELAEESIHTTLTGKENYITNLVR